MRRGGPPKSYTEMSIEEQRTFRRWLVANLVVSSFFVGLLIVMAGVSSFAPAERNSATAAMSSTQK